MLNGLDSISIVILTILEFSLNRSEFVIGLGFVASIIIGIILLLSNQKGKYSIQRIFARNKDINQDKQTQEALVEAESKYRSLVEDSLNGIYIIQDGKFVYVNPQLVQLSGYTNEELVGTEASQHIYPEDLPVVEENIGKRLNSEIKGIRCQYRAVKKDQSMLFLEVHASLTMYKGKPALIGSIIDITEQKKAEEWIQHLAYHDSLTGLSNQSKLYSSFQTARLNQQLKTAGILYLNLDRFRTINDALGHNSGDRLLIEVANKLKERIRPEDCLARLGGDEFIFFLPNLDKEEISRRADQILACLNEELSFDDYVMHITGSIGISSYPHDGDEIETLIQKADVAMHQVKRHGKNNYEFYKNQASKSTNEVFEMEADLRKAIEREEFVVYYQPKVNIQTGEFYGLEALIRWQHPDKGLISPARFIPLAEETGLIVPIGEWVLREACTEIKALQDSHFPRLVVSVNLSVRQFYQPNLIGMVRQILDETRLSPEYLEIEITESMMIDTHHALMIVTELKQLGIRVSLDDFGTGYSSLHYLKKFPIDIIKIDQSFIRDSLTDSNNETIVKTIIAMAHQLKIEVISEGVETKEQLIFLQQNYCEKAQGYLFSKPVPLEEIKMNFAEIEKLVRQIGLPQDLRDQKWIEEALRAAKQELHDTVRQQQGMTFKVKMQDGKFIHTLCDGELLYRLGFVPEQIMGKDVYEILSPEKAPKLMEVYLKAFTGENITYEMEYNGIHLLASLRAIRRGGQITEVIGSCVDITERKQAEEALKVSESKYRLIAENVSDLIRVVTPDGVIQYASPSHQTVLGYAPEEMEGTSTFHLIHPEDSPFVQNKHRGVIASTISEQVEMRHKHADGRWVQVEAKGTPIIGDNGEIVSIVIIARDITGRKQVAESHKSESLAVIGELAAGIAHDIRDPLTSIKGFVQLLKLGITKPEYFDIMLAEFQRVERILQELIVWAKPQTPQKNKLDFVRLLDKVTTTIESQVPLNGIQIKLEFDSEEDTFTFGDEEQLNQVFANILNNAVESMPDGGEISILVKQEDHKNLLVQIVDRGCGISSERMKHLGEPFYNTKEKGIGLGLMVSFRILEEHQGTIYFESEVGKGTTVEVRLPLVAPILMEEEGIK